MSPVANIGSALKNALSGTQRMAVGGGSRIPRFGPAIAAKPTKPVGIGQPAVPSVQNMLSRPKRTRQAGYSKTAPSPKGLSVPKLGGVSGPASAGPGTGGY